jgi:parallel beta-helix repeat protein
MRFHRAVAAGILAAAGLVVAAPATSGADGFDVHPGESIQRAIRRAEPGASIHVAPGTYQANLNIKKPITLWAEGVTIVPKAVPRKSPCSQTDGGTTLVTGICIHGVLDAEGNVTSLVPDVRLRGITVQGFSGDGAFAIGTDHLDVEHATFADNGGYGIFAFHSNRVDYEDSVAHGNGEAGFYVGESPTADVRIHDNVAYDNRAEGLLFRDSMGGQIEDNEFYGNCVGMFLLDTGAPGGDGDVSVRDNKVHENNASCPGDEEEGIPPLSGIGIGVLGAHDASIRDNHVDGNVAGGPSGVPSGGLVVVDTSGFGGTTPMDNRFEDNDLSGNDPDVFWDGTGTGNTFDGNDCSTSVPPGLCA